MWLRWTRQRKLSAILFYVKRLLNEISVVKQLRSWVLGDFFQQLYDSLRIFIKLNRINNLFLQQMIVENDTEIHNANFGVWGVT